MVINIFPHGHQGWDHCSIYWPRLGVFSVLQKLRDEITPVFVGLRSTKGGTLVHKLPNRRRYALWLLTSRLWPNLLGIHAPGGAATRGSGGLYGSSASGRIAEDAIFGCWRVGFAGTAPRERLPLRLQRLGPNRRRCALCWRFTPPAVVSTAPTPRRRPSARPARPQRTELPPIRFWASKTIACSHGAPTAFGPAHPLPEGSDIGWRRTSGRS